MSGQRWEIARRLGAAGEPAEDRLHRASARSQRGVVELLGEPERRTGVVESCPEASPPREATVDQRLELRSRRRLP
jgi:hypothetical protein